jgi:hypothetical protein
MDRNIFANAYVPLHQLKRNCCLWTWACYCCNYAADIWVPSTLDTSRSQAGTMCERISSGRAAATQPSPPWPCCTTDYGHQSFWFLKRSHVDSDICKCWHKSLFNTMWTKRSHLLSAPGFQVSTLWPISFLKGAMRKLIWHMTQQAFLKAPR